MSGCRVVALRDLSQLDSSRPENPERNAQLVSSGPDWAEIELTDAGAGLSVGTPIGFQTDESISLGCIENAEIRNSCQHLRVRVDHSLALQDVGNINRLWSQEDPD